MGNIIFAALYIILVPAILGGLVVAGEAALNIVLRFSPRLRRFFDELPMNREV